MSNVPPSPRQLIGVGANIVGFVVLGLVLGWFLDDRLDTSPLCILIGLAVGVLGAVVSAVMHFRSFLKD
jgi:F0F1-type ATP synthase assembly protein I